MNERHIFLTAIKISDPARRAAYIEHICGTDDRLRAQVQELLSAHERTTQFVDTTDSPADQTIVTSSSEIAGGTGSEHASTREELFTFLEPSARTDWLGKLAHYEIEEILGRGAFGIVVKAFDEKLHRVVAIKLLSPELAASSPPRKRFLREARTAAAVTHENIVAIHAVEEEPIPYLVMEYVSGRTLQQRMDEYGPLEIPEILRIGQQVAAGLAAAHEVKLIHRDIKPSNILLSDGPIERAKLSDFGLARAVDDASLTSSGLIAGTPIYMAPEQARGDTLDHRMDLFSLGSVLYQMTSGRLPFRAASSVAVLKRVCEDTPRSLNEVIEGTPAWLETIIFRLLEKDRDDRYQTAQELADLLARCQRELEHTGKVTCVPSRSATDDNESNPTGIKRRARSRTKSVAWLVGGVIAVAAVIGPMLLNGGKQPADPDLITESATAAAESASGGTASAAEPVGWHGWPDDAPPPAIAPFDAAQAKAHQAAWAEYLKVPVEYENSLGMKFRLIPPGEFLMGSTPEEIDKAIELFNGSQEWRETAQRELPQHRVILTQPVYFGETEVTQDQYEQVMGTNPSHFSATGEEKDAVADLETSTFPVEMVSWLGAAEFCVKLSLQEELSPFYLRSDESVTSLEGNGYRLPTEAEWEFACRAGTTTRFWSGDEGDDVLSAGWFGTHSGGRTHAVGELEANPFGLFDVHGNVAEWVQDTYDAELYQRFADSGAIDPYNPFPGGSTHVIRGSGWRSGYFPSRSSYRLNNNSAYHSNLIGFRVVLAVSGSRIMKSEPAK